ncbi:potassium channel protein [Methanocella sp. CWC-04]|uniref:Potassium channel protein n=2 Tax=Methanooceanicella nereidis TaxID=2052831 RepID=A0AAP2W4D0_9EURY|nr:potassium channel protein [Methanocella sp. CWC-04]
MVLIILNVAVFFIETTGSRFISHSIYWSFEVFSVAVFTVEYILRVWTCPLDIRYTDDLKGRLKYVTTNVLGVADLFAILPFYIAVMVPVIAPLDFRFVRALRLFRIFRLFKLARYSDSLDILERALIRQKVYLALTFAIQVVLLLLSSGLMYYIENDAQPEKFKNIFDSMWWGLIPLTTVGYGDIYPVTPLGKIAGGILTFVGIIVMALPIGIITTGLEEEIKLERKRKRRMMVEEVLLKDVRRIK